MSCIKGQKVEERWSHSINPHYWNSGMKWIWKLFFLYILLSVLNERTNIHVNFTFVLRMNRIKHRFLPTASTTHLKIKSQIWCCPTQNSILQFPLLSLHLIILFVKLITLMSPNCIFCFNYLMNFLINYSLGFIVILLIRRSILSFSLILRNSTL
jgi:hypothetical protein